MPDQEERLDEEAAVEKLNAALELLYRSALGYSVVAASLIGLEAQVVGEKLRGFGDEELSAARELIEKIISFNGKPSVNVAELEFHADVRGAIGWLISCEGQAVEALQEAIEPTGREGRSEALEHLLEHQIMRKQQQVDFLERASSG
jgi:bacterioferritin (cytochrome b1)